MVNWVSYFISKYGANPSCQICGKELVWYGFSDEIEKVVHFDHRTKLVPIKVPSFWIYHHACNPKNIVTWEECNFGILCRKCNTFFPSKNRIEWLQKVSRETEWVIKALKYASNNS
jgi:hypothetical protein